MWMCKIRYELQGVSAVCVCTELMFCTVLITLVSVCISSLQNHANLNKFASQIAEGPRNSSSGLLMSSASDPPVHAHYSGSSIVLLYDLIAFFPSRDPKPRSQSGLNAGVTACHRAAVCWSPGAACPSERQISGSKELREPPAKGRARQEMLTMCLLSQSTSE